MVTRTARRKGSARGEARRGNSEAPPRTTHSRDQHTQDKRTQRQRSAGDGERARMAAAPDRALCARMERDVQVLRQASRILHLKTTS